MTTRRQRLNIRRTCAKEKPTILIGKHGATNEVAEEVKKQLKRNEVVKIRLLRTAREQTTLKEISQRLVEATQSEVIEARGHTVTLFKRKAQSDE